MLIGRTFSDTAAGIHITPVLRGTDPDGTAWIDVTVNRGAFPGNRKPIGRGDRDELESGGQCERDLHRRRRRDPDGDTLGYFWDWGDGTFTANNSATASKSWSTTGTKTVRCYVTDMKGLTTTGQVLVQVGTSSTFFIQGVVTTTRGRAGGECGRPRGRHAQRHHGQRGLLRDHRPRRGQLHADGDEDRAVDPAGRAFFTNPVAVGPNKQNINFTAPPGSPYFATMKAGLLDQGSNTGAVIVPVSDADTPVTEPHAHRRRRRTRRSFPMRASPSARSARRCARSRRRGGQHGERAGEHHHHRDRSRGRHEQLRLAGDGECEARARGDHARPRRRIRRSTSTCARS